MVVDWFIKIKSTAPSPKGEGEVEDEVKCF